MQFWCVIQNFYSITSLLNDLKRCFEMRIGKFRISLTILRNLGIILADGIMEVPIGSEVSQRSVYGIIFFSGKPVIT